MKRSRQKRESRGESWSKRKWKNSLYFSQTPVPRASSISNKPIAVIWTANHKVDKARRKHEPEVKLRGGQMSSRIHSPRRFVHHATNELESPYLDFLNFPQTMDLGNPRHRLPGDAADHLRGDALRAYLLAHWSRLHRLWLWWQREGRWRTVGGVTMETRGLSKGLARGKTQRRN